MAEKWKDVYTQEQIRKIQQLELQNLKELQTVCQQLGIDFFLYGGSLIGAVRHKGFVPWDDDLDIAMLRDDYMRFVREAPKLLGDAYYLQTPYTDKKTPYAYSKLRLRGTKCVEYINHRLGIEHGIYVDIYPIDHMPEDDELARSFKEYQKLIRLYVLRQVPYSPTSDGGIKRKLKNIVKCVVSFVLHLIPQRYFIKRIDRVMTRYNHLETGKWGNLYYPEPKNLFYDLLPLEDGEFEGIKVKLPRNWDRHLTLRYGNYMEFPPEEERIGHKPYLLDFGKYSDEG